MRVFIHYSPKHYRDTFEGSRMRKNIKGACELVGIEWLDFPSLPCDVAHFISPADYPLLLQKKEKGVPCLVSACYSENDPKASFLEEGLHGRLFLTNKARRILKAADMVTVPSEPLKKLLEGSGITTPIEVIEPMVNLTRFADNAEEKEIFLRYFRVHPNTKTVISTGSYHDRATIQLIKQIAALCPELEFYFFGSSSIIDPFALMKSARSAKRTSNLHFCSLVQDDIYRSALMSSLAYISSGSTKPDAIALLEAFASKTQVVGLVGAKKNPLMLDQQTCYLFKGAEDLSAYLNSLSKGKAKQTIMAAFDVAKSHSLLNFGRELSSIYHRLTNQKGDIQ